MSSNYSKPMFKGKEFEGQTFVVTGGGTGLGKAMAKYFSMLGANVAIASRKMEVLQKTAEEISRESGYEVLPVQCDVSDYHQVENLLNSVLEKFGSVNGLVNNAAGNFISPTERLSNRAFDIIVNIVLRGSYNCTLAFGKNWLK
ncbi:MAG: SDR family NAD(P)-dependent oxidoreductase, partial [Ignavibacteria bacterium]